MYRDATDCLVQPALAGFQFKGHDLRRVGFILGLIEFEKHLSVGKLSQDLDLASGSGHAVADTFALAVLQVLGFVHNTRASFQGNLELIFDSAHWTALENIIGNNARAGKFAEEFSEYRGVIVDAFEKNRLILDYESHFAEDADDFDGFVRKFPGMVELSDDIDLFFVREFRKIS